MIADSPRLAPSRFQPRQIERVPTSIDLWLVGLLFILPEVNAVSASGGSIRFDDVIFAVAILRYALRGNLPTWLRRRLLVPAGCVVLSTLAGIAFARVGTLQAVFYAVRPFEYIGTVFLGIAIVRNRQLDSLDKIFKVVVVVETVMSAAQVAGIHVGVSDAAYGRAAGNTGGAYELAAVCGLLLLWFLIRKEGKWALVAAIPLILSASRISTAAIVVLVIIMQGRYLPLRQKLAVIVIGIVLIVGLPLVTGSNTTSASTGASSSFISRIENTQLLSSLSYGKSYADSFSPITNENEYDTIGNTGVKRSAGSSGDQSTKRRFARWFLALRGLRGPALIALGYGPSFVGAAIDGQFVRWIVEGGLLGLLVWLWFWLGLARRLGGLAAYSIVFMLASGAFIDIFESSRSCGMLWLLIGVSIALREQRSRESAPMTASVAQPMTAPVAESVAAAVNTSDRHPARTRTAPPPRPRRPQPPAPAGLPRRWATERPRVLDVETREGRIPRGESGGQIARSGAIGVTGAALGSLANLGIVIALARSFGTADAGILFEALAVVTVLTVAFGSGPGIGLLRMLSSRFAVGEAVEDMIGVAMVPALLGATLLAAGLAIFAGPISQVLTNSAHAGELATIMRWVAPAIPLSALATMGAAIGRACGTTLPTALFDTGGQPVTRLLCVAVILALGLGPTALAIGWSISSAVLAAGALITAVRWLRLRKVDLRRIGHRQPGSFGVFWRFTGPRCLEEILILAMGWLLVLVVGAEGGPADAAVYGAVSRLAMGGTLALQGIIIAVGPRMASLFARREFPSLNALYKTSTAWTIWLSYPVTFLVIGFPVAVLRIVSSSDTRGVSALVAIELAMLFNLATGPVKGLLLMAGRSSWNLGNAFVGTVSSLGIALTFAGSGGALACAIAWGIGIVLANGLALGQIWASYRLQPFGRAALAGMVISGAVVAPVVIAARVIGGDSIVWFVASAAAVAVLMPLVYALMRRLAPGLMSDLRLATLTSRAARA